MRKTRQAGALQRLETQLKKGVKNTKQGTVGLTDGDKQRIEREIETLKKKV